jgi:putative phosphoesterase
VVYPGTRKTPGMPVEHHKQLVTGCEKYRLDIIGRVISVCSTVTSEVQLLSYKEETMKIGVITDSHENMPVIAKAVDLFNREGVEIVLHAGDIISPITAKEFKRLKARMIAVFGNNDGERLLLRERFGPFGEIHERKWEGEIAGKKVLLIHEPDMLDALVKSGCYDIIVYGHTHKIDVRDGRTLVVNPGESSGWLTGRHTVGILDTDRMDVAIRDL